MKKRCVRPLWWGLGQIDKFTKHLMKNHLPKAKQCKWLMQMKPTLGQCGLILNSWHSHDLDSKEGHHPPYFVIKSVSNIEMTKMFKLPKLWILKLCEFIIPSYELRLESFKLRSYSPYQNLPTLWCVVQ
jgi:hypothetical protein